MIFEKLLADPWGSEAYKRGRIKKQQIKYVWFRRDKAALLIRPEVGKRGWINGVPAKCP